VAVVNFPKGSESNKHILSQDFSNDDPRLVPEDALSSVIDCYGNYVIAPTDAYQIIGKLACCHISDWETPIAQRVNRTVD
jgi:hypothetical protein